ncbi:hypothetical protein [Tianweitania sediminis]|uniref:Replication protein n=1 Tax=Tianweitania sediminis TaxID=1502156 RepID=A0A8J7UM71_9HYPH|nr:hypothetical protein [Tianweitania sediminis]MBP0441509.1 hypothetical protein [Tianweitania sediminis]
MFVTLTAAHRRGDRLADLKALVSGASRSARQGRAWMATAREHGIQGVIVGPEVTHGRHGWHFHQHLAVIVSTSRLADAEAAGQAVLGRYMAAISEAGGRALKQGQDVTVVWRKEDLQGYLAKGSAAWEIAAAGTGKEGRGGSRSPWDLVADADAGDRQAAELFREYAAAMPGTRSCVVTKSIADKLGIEPEEDEEAPGEEPPAQEEAEELGGVPRAQWHRLLRHGHVPAVFSVIASGGDWRAISAEIRRLDPGEAEPQRSGPVPWAISALCLAQEARALRGSMAGGSLDAAIGIAVERHRQDAKRVGRPLLLPHLPTVARLLAEGFA